MRHGVSIMLSVALAWMSAGCATMVRGNRQDITFNTEPPGASVIIDGLQGTTPYTVSLDRNTNYVVKIIMEGYREEQVFIKKHFGWLTIFGNLPWLLIGLSVDVASGSAWKLKPKKVKLKLEPSWKPIEQ